MSAGTSAQYGGSGGAGRESGFPVGTDIVITDDVIPGLFRGHKRIRRWDRNPVTTNESASLRGCRGTIIHVGRKPWYVAKIDSVGELWLAQGEFRVR